MTFKGTIVKVFDRLALGSFRRNRKRRLYPSAKQREVVPNYK
jgi:hypothetical protein